MIDKLSDQATLPSAEVYEQECDILPWALLLKRVTEWIVNSAAKDSYIVDYMCGTGRVLHEIAIQRPDLHLAGCTLDPKSYVDFANMRSPNIPIVYQDVFSYRPKHTPDIVICTGGIHHIPRENQRALLEKVHRDLRRDGYFVVGDEVIAPAKDEVERRKAVLELFSGLATWSIERTVSDSVLEAVVEILRNDLFERGEFKTSLSLLQAMLEDYFRIEEIIPIWTGEASDGRYGDFVFICRRDS